MTGPLSLWAALMITVGRDAFGHDPRPQAADLARASITYGLDQVAVNWRKWWNH